MTPVSQPGSRAGLISGLVISVILCVVFISLTFYYKLEAEKNVKDKTETEQRYAPIATDGDLGSPEIKGLLADSLKAKQGSLVKYLIWRGKEGIKPIINSEDLSPFETEAKRASAVATANRDIEELAKNIEDPETKPEKVPDNASLVTIEPVVAKAAIRQSELKRAALEEIKRLKAEIAAAETKHTQELAEKDKIIVAKEAEKNKVAAEVTAVGENKNKEITALQEQVKQRDDKAQETLQDFTKQLQIVKDKVAASEKQIVMLQDRLAKVRMTVTGPIVRQPDGHILNTAPGNIVYIDLGKGEHVPAGLTFEVYAKDKGVPQFGDGLSDDQLPEGKASIEVIRVDQASCECRVTRLAGGEHIEQGDIIANLIYDKNIQPVFFVYGDFDTDKDGRATPQEADVIKRLITQWGGKLSNTLNLDVDFVIMGKEPVVPTFTEEEKKDPVNQAKFDQARAALEGYEKVRQDGRDVHIPMMNQNRFLYFIGYFDQVGREAGH